MKRRLAARLDILSGPDFAGVFADARRGIEKEGLRVTESGELARTPHPSALGSALTNRYITTDYSEALLEFVTPPLNHPWAATQFLCDIHQFVYAALTDEIVWALSMPCRLSADDPIPLARYGSSNIGTMKTIYRRGLGYRYGRLMQSIAGIHFNYSLPESFWPVYANIEESTGDLAGFRSAAYLGLVRNVRRLDWLLLYLFGASPAICRSFFGATDAGLDEFDHGTLYGPHATSLRMSEIGYQNKNQADLHVSANSLAAYIDDLSSATRRPHPEYARVGVKVDGEYRQLNANQLQIENEYYSTIRPKHVALSGEHPTAALLRGGVEYVELRALDISPFDPIGITGQQLAFLETFLVYCLLLDSPPIDADERVDTDFNRAAVARRGREPGLELRRDGGLIELGDWGREIFSDLAVVAELLDAGQAASCAEAVEQQRIVVETPELSPSGRLLADLRETGQTLSEFGLELSRDYRDYFRALATEVNRNHGLLAAEARESIDRQRALEASDQIDFETYLEQYFA